MPESSMRHVKRSRGSKHRRDTTLTLRWQRDRCRADDWDGLALRKNQRDSSGTS